MVLSLVRWWFSTPCSPCVYLLAELQRAFLSCIFKSKTHFKSEIHLTESFKLLKHIQFLGLIFKIYEGFVNRHAKYDFFVKKSRCQLTVIIKLFNFTKAREYWDPRQLKSDKSSAVQFQREVNWKRGQNVTKNIFNGDRVFNAAMFNELCDNAKKWQNIWVNSNNKLIWFRKSKYEKISYVLSLQMIQLAIPQAWRELSKPRHLFLSHIPLISAHDR